MRYQALKHKNIKLEAKGQFELDSGEGLNLIPDDGSKVFIHWKNESGKLVSTYTMTFPTYVEGKVTLINALDKPANIRAIW